MSEREIARKCASEQVRECVCAWDEGEVNCYVAMTTTDGADC